MLWTLADLLIRSALVLLFADLLRRSSRSSHPAYRHTVLLAGFVILLLWPLFSWFVPEVYVPLAFTIAGQGHVTVQESIRARSESGHLASSGWLTVGIWITGILCGLVSLAAGQIRVLRLKRRAVNIADDDRPLIEESLRLSRLTRIPSIRIFPEQLMPQTFGILRPCILLPPDWAAWSSSRKRAVLLHEFAHISRRDTASLLAVNLAAILWWFQPLCWIMRRRVRAESEQACDAQVIASGLQPSVYAAELLAIAQLFRPGLRSSAAALPMADSSSLPLRLQAILGAPRTPCLRRSTVGAVAALLCWATACSAITVALNGQLISKGGVSMRRTLFATMSSGLLTSASLSAAAIGGSILDPSGAAVLNAKASLYNPDTRARQEAMSMANGKFEFDNLAAGQYILRVEKPGFSPILRAFAVQQNATVDRGLILRSDSDPQALDKAADTMPHAPGQGPVRIGGQVAQSNLVDKVQPVYPAAAKSAGVQGTVLLEAVISAEGMPQELRVVSSPSDDLSQSALEAVRQWRYRPVLLNGNPVEVITNIVVNYTLAP